VNDLVPAASGSLRVMDDRQHLIPQFSHKPRFGQGSHMLALLGTACSTRVIRVDAAIQMVPQHPHLNIKPRSGDRYAAELSQDVKSGVHADYSTRELVCGGTLRLSSCPGTRLVAEVDAGAELSDPTTCFLPMMSQTTCALLAQVMPVFLLIFAVRDGRIVASLRREERPARGGGWRGLQARLRADRTSWRVVTFLMIFMEAWFVAASDGLVRMPALVGYLWFGLVLLYAWVEIVAHTQPDGDPSDSDSTQGA
jgi:hypothetical protein